MGGGKLAMKSRVFERKHNYIKEPAPMMTRRDAVRLMSSASLGLCIAPSAVYGSLKVVSAGEATPPLTAGSPMSPERLALIERFKKASDGLQNKFEAHTYKSDWVMPYRLFRPKSAGKLPLVVYLHGSGGQGDDNEGEYLRNSHLAASGKPESLPLLCPGAPDESRLGAIRSRKTEKRRV
jgi:hypothetical protein